MVFHGNADGTWDWNVYNSLGQVVDYGDNEPVGAAQSAMNDYECEWIEHRESGGIYEG